MTSAFDDEIFMGLFKTEATSEGNIFSSPEQDSSPSSFSDSSPSFSSSPDAFNSFISPEGTFFNDIGMFAHPDTFTIKKEPCLSPDFLPENYNTLITDIDQVGEPPLKKAKIAGKKRTRQSPSRENLLLKPNANLSSQKLEEYVNNISASRPLTTEETKQLKRQRRLIKNRESAQLSRQKKKQYVEDLERNAKFFEAEAKSLREQVAHLTNRNQNLEEEVSYLRNYIQQDQAGSQLGLLNKNTAAKAGLCMFVILFSFGLFFSASHPAASSGLVQFQPRTMYAGRTLSEFPAIEGVKEFPQIAAKRTERDFESPEIRDRKQAKVSRFSEVSTISEIEEVEELALPAINVHEPLNFPSMKQSNSSTIYCSEVHQLASPLPIVDAEDQSPIINVLLPASVLNTTLPFVNDMVSDPETALLEVSCQVLNISVFPYLPNADHLASAQQLLS